MDETNVIETTEEMFNQEASETIVEAKTQDDSNLFMIDEMSDAISASMDNIKEVYEKQERLISLLEAVNNEEFAELISSMKEQVEYMKIQHTELETRKIHLDYVLACCRDNEDTAKLVDKLLLGLGIFKNS